jgi:pimeloyl-ACP methyl ester carboxylesterase
MPNARVNEISLYDEEAGQGTPLVFVHEFAGEARSWPLQIRFFACRYRAIAVDAGRWARRNPASISASAIFPPEVTR